MKTTPSPTVSAFKRRPTVLATFGLLTAAAMSVATGQVSLPSPNIGESSGMDSGPGGAGLPELIMDASSTAPAISAISEITHPGETLVMSGAGLKGAKLKLWSEGGLVDVEPLFAYEDRLAAVVPESAALSTMLVWPERDGVAGQPIRVNGSTVWWCWPAQVSAGVDGSLLRVVGKNLKVGEAKPLVRVVGEGFEADVEVKAANPYRLEVALPSLAVGTYRLWSHNGSGGKFGWSKSWEFEVVESTETPGNAVVDATEFGAIPDDGKDDHEALTAAVAAASKQGGGTIQLPAGELTLHSPLMIDADHVTLRGVGRGDYLDGEEKVSGEFTALTYGGAAKIPSELLDVSGAHFTAENLTVINGHHGGDKRVIALHGSGATLRELRVICLDRRDWGYRERGPWGAPGEKRKPGPYTKEIIDNGAVLIDTEGLAETAITDCEIHATGPGVQIGRFTGWGTSKSQPLSDSVWIDSTRFVGHYAGEPDGKDNPGASGRATGVVIYSGRQIGVQNSTFEGADRTNRRIMGRTVLAFNTAGRNFYFGENESTNVGPHPSAEGMDHNQGEQYLIHYRYPHGGLFNVTEASAETVSITTENIVPFPEKADPKARWDLRRPHFHFDTRGGQVLDEVGDDGNWILFVSAGKGVGQFREVRSVDQTDGGYTFAVDEPWRVVPDETSRVNLAPAYRHITLYKNLVDTGKLIETMKSHGVTFWFDCFDNVVDGNTFRNLTSGIIFNSRFRGPTAWNSTRENVVENIYGDPGDTSETAAGYVDHTRLVVEWPKEEDRVWYQVGNVSRRNVIRNAEVGVYLHTRYTGLVRGPGKKPPTVPHPDGGMVLSVVELDQIENVGKGIVVSSPLNAAVVRDNQVTLTAGGEGPAVINQDAESDIVDSFIEGNDGDE